MMHCVTQYAHGKEKADPAEHRVRHVRNTRGAPKDVAVRPSLVLTDAPAPSVGAVRRLPIPLPEESAALVPAHHMES